MLTRESKSLLLYFETCMVDSRGMVEALKISAEDMERAEKLVEQGFIEFGRLPGSFVFNQANSKYTHYVNLTEAGWDTAHYLREERAKRNLPQRQKLTGLVIPKQTIEPAMDYSKINMEDFAEVFHTGFRKALDNMASVIVWNAIYLLEGAWKELLEKVLQGEGNLKERWTKALEWHPIHHATTLFQAGLEMMTDRDWQIIEDWMKCCLVKREEQS